MANYCTIEIRGEIIMKGITKEIINYIKTIKEGELKNWYAGVTNNLARRKEEHEREKNILCKHLKGWRCQTEKEAREIEQELKLQGISIYEEDLKIIAKKQEPSTSVYVFLAVKKSQHFIRLLKK